LRATVPEGHTVGQQSASRRRGHRRIDAGDIDAGETSAHRIDRGDVGPSHRGRGRPAARRHRRVPGAPRGPWVSLRRVAAQSELHEWEVVSRPVTFKKGHEVRARVQRPGDPGTAREKYWAAHEKITVRR